MVIGQLNPLKGEQLIILADPQRMIQAGAQTLVLGTWILVLGTWILVRTNKGWAVRIPALEANLLAGPRVEARSRRFSYFFCGKAVDHGPARPRRPGVFLSR